MASCEDPPSNREQPRSILMFHRIIQILFRKGHSSPNQHKMKSLSSDFVQISCTSWVSWCFTSAQIPDRSAKWCGRYGGIIFGRVQPTGSGRMYKIDHIFHILQRMVMNLVSLESAFDSLSIDPTHNALVYDLDLLICPLRFSWIFLIRNYTFLEYFLSIFIVENP